MDENEKDETSPSIVEQFAHGVGCDLLGDVLEDKLTAAEVGMFYASILHSVEERLPLLLASPLPS